MDINNYNLYSKISETNESAQKDLEDIMALIKKFDEIDNISGAKQYLEDTWNLTEDKSKYPIGGGCLISLKETDMFFKINLLVKDENITYLYAKNKGGI